MVRSLWALTLVLILGLGAIIPRLQLAASAPRGAGHAPAPVRNAVSVIAAPPGTSALDRIDDSTPLFTPLLVRAVIRVGLAVIGEGGNVERYRFAVAFEDGDPRATRWTRIAWTTLTLVAMAALALTALTLTRRAGRSARSTHWSVVVAPALLAVAPLAVGGTMRVDPALPAILFGIVAALLLIGASGGADHWRWILAGALVGMAIGAHGQALVFIGFLALGVGGRRGHDIAVRISTALIACALGALVIEPRIADNPGFLVRRLGDALVGQEITGGVRAGAQLLSGLSPLPLALALVGALALARQGARARWTALALAAPAIALMALPLSDASTAFLCLPSVLLLAGAGAGALDTRTGRRGLAATVTIAALAWPAALTASRVVRSGKGDSRDAAAGWLAENLSPDARVVTDFYGPDIPPGHVSFMLPFNPRDPSVYAGAYDPGWYDGFDTFILVGTQVQRYERDPEAARAQLAFISTLRRSCRQAARFESGPYAGPTIEILTRDPTSAVRGVIRLAARDRVDPAVPGFYTSLGAAYRRMGSLEAALALLHVASRLAPGDPEIAVNVAAVQMEAGHTAEADTLLRRAIHRNPGFPPLRFQYGVLKQQQKLWNDAIGEYKMAIRYDPTFVEATYNLAICYLEAGNRGAALSFFTRVVQLAPEGRLAGESTRMIGELGER